MKKKGFKWILAVDLLAALLLCVLCGCAGSEGEEPVGAGTVNKTYSEKKSKILQPVFSDRGGFYGNKMAVRITVPESFQKTSGFYPDYIRRQRT